MPTRDDSPPDRSIQGQFADALQRYSGLKAVLEDPRIPPRGKLLLAANGSAIAGSVILGLRTPDLAFGTILASTLSIALLLHNQKDGAPRGIKRPYPAKPRSRRAHKAESRDPP